MTPRDLAMTMIPVSYTHLDVYKRQIVLFFYRLNKKRYNEIVEDLKKQDKINPRY